MFGTKPLPDPTSIYSPTYAAPSTIDESTTCPCPVCWRAISAAKMPNAHVKLPPAKSAAKLIGGQGFSCLRPNIDSIPKIKQRIVKLMEFNSYIFEIKVTLDVVTDKLMIEQEQARNILNPFVKKCFNTTQNIFWITWINSLWSIDTEFPQKLGAIFILWLDKISANERTTSVIG